MKALVFWLDGAEPHFINQLELPVMKGRYGWQPYECSIALTGPQLSSFFLGKTAHEHGITRYRGSTDQFRTAGEPIWVAANNLGKSVGLLNMPYTYPPPKVNGWVVSGLGTEVGKVYTHPTKLYLDLDAMDYVIHPEINRETRCYGFLPYEGRGEVWTEDVTFRKWMDCFEKRMMAAKYLLRKFPVDLGVVGVSCLGAVGHVYSELNDRVKKFYKTVDSHVGWLIGTAKPEHVFLLSDHGFRDHQHSSPAYFSSSLGTRIEKIEDAHGLIMGLMK